MLRTGLMLLAMAILIAACDPKPAESPPSNGNNTAKAKAFVPNPAALEKVIYAGSNWYGHAPVWAGLEQGFFKEAGFELEKLPVGASAERVQLLAAGSAHFASLGEVAMLSAMDAGEKGFYWIGNQNIAPGNEGLVARKGINSITELKGKRIAVNMNSSVHLTVAMLLEDHGLKISDVELVRAQNDEGAILLEKGEVDAACIWEPFYTRLREVPGSKVLATDENTSIYARFKTMSGPDMVCASKKWVDEHPERAKALMKAYFKAVAWCQENPEELVNIVAREAKQEEKISEVKAALSKIQWLGWAQQPKAIENLLNQSRVASRIMKDMGMIKGEPAVINWTYPELYR